MRNFIQIVESALSGTNLPPKSEETEANPVETGKEGTDSADAVAESEELDEVFGGPREFGGFGRGIFRRAFYAFIARECGDIHDEVAREHVADWFAMIFKKDSPGFKPEAFKKAAMTPGYRVSTRPTFQQRHFYYLAHCINQIADPHMKEFMTNWVGEAIGHTNENFNPTRWKHFCETGSNPKEPRKPRDDY